MHIDIKLHSLLHQIKQLLHLHHNLALLLNLQHLAQLLSPPLPLLLQIHIAQTMPKRAALAAVGDTTWKMASAILSIINVAAGLQKEIALNVTWDISQSMVYANCWTRILLNKDRKVSNVPSAPYKSTNFVFVSAMTALLGLKPMRHAHPAIKATE